MALAIGTRVAIRDTYLDEALTRPLVGTIRDRLYRDDWGAISFVVMFDHDNRMLPPGGEFQAHRLMEVHAA